MDTTRRLEKGPGPARRGWSGLASARRGALWLTGLWIIVGTVSPLHAAQTVTGERRAPLYRAVVSLRGMAEFERKFQRTNQEPAAVHAPYPDGATPVDDQAARASARPTAVPPPGQDSEAGGGQGGGVGFSPLPADSFLALDDLGTSIPPDTHGAAGPNHLMVVLNTQIRVQTRTGTPLITLTLDNFWSPLGNPNAFDPKVIYDHMNDRWMITAMADSFAPSSGTLMAVSQTADPTGNWFMFRYDADPTDNSWVDYPSMGHNKDWIVVSVNIFPITIAGVNQAEIYVFSKADLYANGPGAVTVMVDNQGGFTHVPAVTYDDTLDTLYLVEVDQFDRVNFFGTQSQLRISTITGTVGNEVLNLGTAFAIDGTNTFRTRQGANGGSAPQLGSGALINNNDCRIQNAVFRNGALWCTHMAFLVDSNPNNIGGQHAAVQWWQLDPSDGSVLQVGRINDPSGVIHYAFPSIAVNAADDVLIGYSRFSPSQYASANYSFRSGIDPPNSLQADIVLKAGEAPYFKTFGGGRNRWGDYSATVVDPVNDIDMWTIQEYAATPRQGQDRWGTWWGRIDVVNTSPFRFQFSSADYTVLEDTPGFATITVNNVGGSPGAVDYTTSDGSAIAGVDYVPSSGTLTFGAGQSSTNFSVRVLDNSAINSNKTVNLTLSNPTGGSDLGFPTNAVLTIIDDETIEFQSEAGEFNFSSYLNLGLPYFASENETLPWPCGLPLASHFTPFRSAPGAIVTVVRTNGSRGRVMVTFSTALGGSAVPGLEYTPITTNLVFADHQMATNVLIPVFSDFVNNGFGTVRLTLSDPVPDPAEEAAQPGVIRPTLGMGRESTLFILETCGALTNETFGFERYNWRTDEYPVYNTPGGQKSLNLQIILPATGPGSVEFRMFNAFEGLTDFAGSDFAQDDNPGTRFVVYEQPEFTDPTLMTLTNYSDYVASNSLIINFADNQCRVNLLVLIDNDSQFDNATEVEFNEEFIVELRQIPGNFPVIGPIATVTILYDEQPAGALDREWNPDNDEDADPPFNLAPGANNIVSTVAVQQDGKTLLGGDFTSYNGRPRNRLARLNPNGSLDLGFTPGTGADGFVTKVLVYPTNTVNGGKILVAGGFQSFNGLLRRRIVRLFPNGQPDPSFNPGTGANDSIRDMVLQDDGRIIVVGSFTQFDDINRPGIARLNSDGTLDFSLDPGQGADGTIRSVTLEPNFGLGQNVIVAGEFFFFDNEFNSGVARLLPNGSLDPSFNTGAGADKAVFAVEIQPDGAVLIAGEFGEIDLQPRSRIARLNSDGSLDQSFDPGGGANDAIFDMILQPDNKILIGGVFTEYNFTRRLGYARLLPNAELDTSFLDTGYNQFAGLINDLSFEPPNFVNSIALQPDGNIMIGGSFTNIGGNPSLDAIHPTRWLRFTRADKRVRYNIARVLGGNTPGPGNAAYEMDEFFTDENGDVVSVELRRQNGRLGTLTVDAATEDRLAKQGEDYVATNSMMNWPEDTFDFEPISEGVVAPIYLRVPLLDDFLREGDELLDLRLRRPRGSVTLGGEYIPLAGALGRQKAVLTISDNDFDAGEFNFARSVFFTNENATFALISVIRTNGSVGTVSVDYFTEQSAVAPVAITPEDYIPTSGRLSFTSGQTNRTFLVRIVDDPEVEFDENIALVLTNAAGGARLSGGTAVSIARSTLTIIDNDLPSGRLAFSAPTYTNAELSGVAQITVNRTGGNVGYVTVDYFTVDGSATSPADYMAVSGTLEWDNDDGTPRFINVPLVRDDTVEGPENFVLVLTNASSAEILGLNTNAVMVIADSDSYGQAAFSQVLYRADENGGAAIITVVRTDGLAGPFSVDFATMADTAVPGTDYVETNGTFTFLAGEMSKTFTVQLLDESDGDGAKTVSLLLANPVNGQLGALAGSTLEIIDDESFNIPAGSADTVFNDTVSANGTVYDIALQPDGRFFIGGDFSEVNNVIKTRLARLLSNGNLDTTFDPGPGPNGSVRVLKLQPDGKLLLGGLFTEFAGTNRFGLARVNIEGTLDNFFNPGSGADNPVFDLAIQGDGKILVGGAFSSFNGVNRPGIVRLNTNATVDLHFNVGAGVNGSVRAVALQPDGKVVIGGRFTLVDSRPLVNLARLNRDGSVDDSFVPPSLDGDVQALLVQADGRIVIGGTFTAVDGLARGHLARVMHNGSLDLTFLDGVSGADNVVLKIAQQIDGKLVVAGDFTRVNGVTRNRITRLNEDGSTDPTINFGTGANAFVAALQLQPDRNILIGGGFTEYDDVQRLRLARIYGGSLSGAGGLQFSQPRFSGNEEITNAVIRVRRRGGTTGEVGVNYQTVPLTAIPGVDYVSTAGTLTFPEGETQVGFDVTIIDDSVPDGDKLVRLELVPGTYTGGATNGLQPVSVLTIFDNEGRLGFLRSDFSVGENDPGAKASIVVTRSGGTDKPASVEFMTVAGGTATPGVDYLSTNGVLNFLAGEVSKNFNVRVINDTSIEGNETVLLALTNPSGSNVLTVAQAQLTIFDDDMGPGVLNFAAASYVVQESNTNLLISVLRTNGSSGLITAQFATANNTAIAGLDYQPTNSLLTFADGQISNSFRVRILEDMLVEPAERFGLSLFNVTGGASAGTLTNTEVTIIDNDVSLIVPAGATLITESISPANNAIDPGETVTVEFALRNVGTLDTAALMATLLAETGVTQPSPPANYGALPAGGTSVSRPYTFTAVGTSGQELLASFLLTDGGVTNGNVTFRFTLSGRASLSFTNTEPITINDRAQASPYPATNLVLGVGGLLTKVSVSVQGLTHGFPDDIDMLLEGPFGQQATLLSDAGGRDAVSGLNITFDGNATNQLADTGPLISGVFLPTNYAGIGTADAFPPPAPLGPYDSSDLTVYQGVDPNGVWRLYVVDDTGRDDGQISGGWVVHLETEDPVSPAADLSVTAEVLSPSPLSQGGEQVCLLRVMNNGPSAAHGVVVTESLSGGLQLMSSSVSQGTTIGAGGGGGTSLQWYVGSLAHSGTATATLTARATSAGLATTVVHARGNQMDMWPADNTLTTTVSVVETPVLSVIRSGGLVIVSWVLPEGPYVVESASSLTNPQWQPVTQNIVVANSRVSLSVNAAAQQTFYRLKLQ